MQRDIFICSKCRYSMMTRVAAYIVVPGKGGTGNVLREELDQPWCCLFGQPMPLNTNSPIIKCEGFMELKEGEQKIFASLEELEPTHERRGEERRPKSGIANA